MNYHRASTIVCIALGITSAHAATATPVPSPAPLQQSPGGPEQPGFVVSPDARNAAIDALVSQLNASYVFPVKAKQIEAFLRSQQRKGAYEGIKDGAELARRLTADVNSIAKDAHMEVAASAEILPLQPATDFRSLDLSGDPTALEANPDMRRIGAIEKRIGTYGVAKAERITPRIGYLAISHFAPPLLAAQKYADTMRQFADADAMIIDVRQNGGGFPHSVALLTSYFVDQRTHVSDLWSRESGKTLQFWTSDIVAGSGFGGKKPVVILVGPGTKSAGEDFAYAMQSLKRATIIGAPTWGGAHPAGNHRLTDHFSARIPDYRSISPITGSNWEGVGVVPDVVVAPADAIGAATKLLQRQAGG